MPSFLFLALFTAIHLSSFSQLSDMITVRKKSGRVLKTFLAGSPIAFTTIDGNYFDGVVKTIGNDTVLVTEYDIKAVPTRFGVNVVDTVASYLTPVAFHEIARIKVSGRERFSQVKMGNLLMLGGAGYFALNLINGNYLRVPFSSPANIRTLVISAGAFGLGLFIEKFLQKDNFSRKKHSIQYIRLR